MRGFVVKRRGMWKPKHVAGFCLDDAFAHETLRSFFQTDLLAFFQALLPTLFSACFQTFIDSGAFDADRIQVGVVGVELADREGGFF